MDQVQHRPKLRSQSSARSTGAYLRWFPALDIGLAALAAAIWYVRPQEGVLPLAFVGVAWLLRLGAYRELTRRTAFDLPLLLFLLSALVSALIAFNQGSQWLEGTTPLTWAWAKFWSIVAGIALFYAIANLRSVDQLWWFARACALFGIVVAFYYVLSNNWVARAGKFDVLSRLGAALSEPFPDVPGRRLHPNTVGGIIAMLTPFAIALLMEARSRGRAWLPWLAATALLLLGLLLSASRGAWIALAAAIAFWTLWRLAAGRTRRVQVLLGVGGLILFGFAVVLASLTEMGSIGVVSSEGTSSVVSRMTLWRAAWSVGGDYLLTGAGLGSVAMLLSAYYFLIPVLFVIHSHSLFLDMLIEQGMLALLVFGSLVIVCVVMALRARQTERDARARWLAEAALASLLVMLLHGVVDDVMYGSRALMLLFVPFGIVAALQPRRVVSVRRVQWPIIAAAAIALSALVFWQRDALLAMAYADLGALRQTRAELSDYHFPERIPEVMRHNADLSGAIGSFARALEYVPRNRTAAQRLAMIALTRGQYEEARAYVEPLYARDPNDEVTWQLLGDAYLALGRSDEAFALWSRIADAPTKLHTEAFVRYRDDKLRSAWADQMADRIRAARR
ncbi:MAG: O-antigen ligase family protein [Chloroflexi bacterium]|nr:O-antigen ligase family protein [Chloroflexota bacterium]